MTNKKLESPEFYQKKYKLGDSKPIIMKYYNRIDIIHPITVKVLERIKTSNTFENYNG